MAIDLDDVKNDLPVKRGHKFEDEVRQYLKQSLSNDYVFRSEVLIPDGGYGKEIDFLVAGPKGVIVVEAKQVEGSVTGGPSDPYWVCKAPGMEERYIDRPFRALWSKRLAVKECIEKRDTNRTYFDYREPLALFVFSNNAVVSPAILRINEAERYFRAVHLRDLAGMVERWSPTGMGAATRPLKHNQAEHILGWVAKSNKVVKPEMVGQFRIISVDDEIYETESGVEYSIGVLEEAELGVERRGKRYEIADGDMENFEDRLLKFRRHASVISEINHPHVHRYFTFLRSNSGRAFWVVEEKVDGDTLDELLRQKVELSLGEIRKIMTGVARGLHAVHEKGVVHRELTPRSIIVEKGTQRAIVTNFELAKLLKASPGGTVSKDRIKKTRYSAPEVASDPHNVDRRVDIYSWGAILFRLLTGVKYKEAAQGKLDVSADRKADLDLSQLCLAREKELRPNSFEEVLEYAGWED